MATQEQQVTQDQQDKPACKVTLVVRDLPDPLEPLQEQPDSQELAERPEELVQRELPEELVQQVTQVQVRLDLLDPEEGHPVHLELQVNLEQPGRLEPRELAAALVRQVCLEPSARRVPLDLRVRQEKLAKLEPRGKREEQALLVTLGLLERRDLRAAVAELVGQDLAGKPEQLERAVQQVFLGRTVSQGAQVQQERRDRLERMVQAALPETRDLLGRLGLLEPELTEPRGLQGLQERAVKPAQPEPELPELPEE
jgi:hypothetical protein